VSECGGVGVSGVARSGERGGPRDGVEEGAPYQKSDVEIQWAVGFGSTMSFRSVMSSFA